MPKPISAADRAPVRCVIVTLDNHLAGAVERARYALSRELPGLSLSFHAAAEWSDDPAALERCRADIAQGDIVVATMLFMEDHIQAVLPALQARRERCDAMVGCMSAGEVTRLTRLGRFNMSGAQGGPLALLKRLRGDRKDKKDGGSSGAQQMACCGASHGSCASSPAPPRTCAPTS
jgi:magnesium chelatase subunit H